MEVKEGNKRSWSLTAVYASPQENLRKLLWEDIYFLSQNNTGEWLLVGDFNDISSPWEKKGGSRVDVNACRRFLNWVEKCGLIDLGFIGSKFTWKGPKWEGLDRVFKRLDRALSNASWRTRFQEAKVEVLSRSHSDHHPILVTADPLPQFRRERPFKYEAMWSLHPEHNEYVRKCWNNHSNLNASLTTLTESLRRWNKETFGNIQKKKEELRRRIGGIQKADSYGRNPFLEELEK
ncbi:uncharacterized protein LOC130945432 [Arachis stenosperma]|uniref:uncharacterized protein LOC130945432 n=1 Tax=Arachis stenosperma TaxID=217475 RepID=UPI0025AB769D|nr:uncharacterized protein LOC130945432 [Arachis stenosperma]